MVRWQTPGRPTPFVLVALAALVVAGIVLNVWGIVGDLPYAPDVDEPVIVQAAIHAIQHASLDPGWFGHPGSTIVYPTAALIELWFLAARHVPPFAHAMPALAREVIVDPTPFYLIARLVPAAYGVAALVATWLLARRLVGDIGGLLAAVVVLTTSIVVLYGHLARTDTAGLFFALVALWLLLRAMEHGRWRDWILAAVAIGLAVSTRYFYATLIVPYAVAAVLWLRTAPTPPGLTRAWHVPLVSILATPVAFALTSPFVLLRLPQVIQDLRFEAKGDHPGADGLSFLGNLRWYLASALPANVNLSLLILAVVGFVIVARSDRRAMAVLAAFAASYLIGVSAAPLHWDRYVIPLVPLVGIGVAATVLTFADLVVSWASRWRAGRASSTAPIAGGAVADGRTSRGPTATLIAVLIVGALVLPSVLAIAGADRVRSVPSTRAVASDWIRENLPPASRIAAEMYTLYGDGDDGGHRVLRVSSLGDRPLSAYRADGYRYLLWSSAMADRFVDAARYPDQHALYAALEASGRPLATFSPSSDRSGPEIRVYEIAGS